MFTRGVCGLIGFALATVLLTGCASRDQLASMINGRWGPDPTLPADQVNTVIVGQVQVLAYLAQGSGLAQTDAATGKYIVTPDQWIRVAEWGFNVGRQDCEVYLDNLFRMNREKQRNDSVLAALATGAAAVLTGTNAGVKSLSIVAAAFGLSIAVNDAVFQSYLFTESPGLIANKVKDLQDAYRDSIEQNATKITTADAAYSAIQGYYHICLPQSIEGTLLQAVANTTATASNPNTPPTKQAPVTSIHPTTSLIQTKQ
jgi:hypothetical protein